MAKSKKNDDTPRTAQELLEARVDAMMDPKVEAPPPAPAVPEVEPASAPILQTKPKPQPQPAPEPTKEPELTLPQNLEDIVVTTEEPAEITVDPAQLDTPQSDEAIDDIVAQEADEVLAAEDAGLAQAQSEAAKLEPQKHGHPIFWFIILVLVILVIIAGVALVNPNIRLPFSA